MTRAHTGPALAATSGANGAARPPCGARRAIMHCDDSAGGAGRADRLRSGSLRACLEFLVRLPDRLPVCLLPPVVAVFPEEAHGPPIKQVQTAACEANTAARAPGMCEGASSFEDTSGAAAPRSAERRKRGGVGMRSADGWMLGLMPSQWLRSGGGTHEPLNQAGMHARKSCMLCYAEADLLRWMGSTCHRGGQPAGAVRGATAVRSLCMSSFATR